jgi:hypothetical protein
MYFFKISIYKSSLQKHHISYITPIKLYYYTPHHKWQPYIFQFQALIYICHLVAMAYRGLYIWLRMFYNEEQFTWTQHLLYSIPYYIQSIFLKMRIWHSVIMAYKGSMFDPDRSIMKGSLQENRATSLLYLFTYKSK